jgi:hypothetical protein
MAFVDGVLDRIGNWLAGRLEEQSSGYEPYTPSDPETLRRFLEPGDILLVEGNQRVSTAIKYLTQSTWSHAAIYVGDMHDMPGGTGEDNTLIEVNIGTGCIAVPLSKYQTYNTRICRPLGLTFEDRRKVIQFMVERLGLKYDMRNIVDLARYLLPTLPVPVRWRRRMIAIGSGEPTRAICSTLIARAFQEVQYPILPRIQNVRHHRHDASRYSREEILHIRHHSLFAPRDFDVSPYFKIIKPTIEFGFYYKALNWATAGQHAITNDHGGEAMTISPKLRNV